jgi:DNA-binding CsgD family transcriptional regulator
VRPAEGGSPFVGRERLRDELAAEVERASAGGGRIVLLRGEAGAGKTRLVREVFADRDHVYVGACDDLLVPQALGPLWDVARGDPSLAAALDAGERRAVFDAVRTLLAGEGTAVLVLEDLHWADEATLDLVLHLGRRIAATSGLLVLTYRDGEVDLDHPLRRVTGALPADRLTRLRVPPLAEDDVARLAEGSGWDPAEVLRLTGGNALFVREVLATTPGSGVPASVRDAVVARGSGLGPAARRIVDLVSLAPEPLDLSVLDEVADGAEALDEAGRAGLLRVEDGRAGFHHEIARQGWQASLPTTTRARLSRTLLRRAEVEGDAALAAHHARGAGDVDALLRWAPQAAEAASAVRSHREAAGHYRAVRPHLHRLPPSERARVLRGHAEAEFYSTGDDVVEVLDAAVAAAREAGDTEALGEVLTFVVRPYEIHGRGAAAAAAAEEAVAVLGDPPRTGEARALAMTAWLHMMHDRPEEALVAGRAAVERAEAESDRLALVHARNSVGAALGLAGDDTGVRMLEDVAERADAWGLDVEHARALTNLADVQLLLQRFAAAADTAARGTAVAVRHEVGNQEYFTRALRAEALLWSGDWDEVLAETDDLVSSNPFAEAHAGWVRATVLTRRGLPGADALVRGAWARALEIAEPQIVVPAAAALAEHVWTTGAADEALVAALGDLRGGLRPGRWRVAWLDHWLWRLGVRAPDPEAVAPFGALMTGEASAAASGFERAGRPFEVALALAAGDADERRRAVDRLDDLGAGATVDRLRADLRRRGVVVPRGRDRRTRAHPARLTPRQHEVLVLVERGLTNAQIGDELFLSPKTVEHHVGALLARLDAADRAEAVRRAREIGLLGAG